MPDHRRSDDFERTFRNRTKEIPVDDTTDPGLEGVPSQPWVPAVSDMLEQNVAVGDPDNPDGYTMYLAGQPKTKQGERTLSIAADVLELFLSKNNGYGEPEGDDLGSKGQFADMHRKWKRIRKHLWDGEPWPESGESFEEVLYDFVGHILLTIDFKRRSL